MSLTKFLAVRDVRAEFRRRFVKPPLGGESPLLAPPRSELYALTGTAFDYLFRFTVLKQHGRVDDPEKWVAHEGAARAASGWPRAISRRASRVLSDAVLEYGRYTRARSRLPDGGLIDASIGLARVDLIVRIGEVDFALPAATRGLVAADLERLVSVIPLEQFKAERQCLPNPTFGAASRLVGGADADLILDGTLWDLKVTKMLDFTREMFNQLIGYCCLARLGGVDRCRPRRCHLERAGIYFARHAVLRSFALADVPGVFAPEFLGWFREEARAWATAG